MLKHPVYSENGFLVLNNKNGLLLVKSNINCYCTTKSARIEMPKKTFKHKENYVLKFKTMK